MLLSRLSSPFLAGLRVCGRKQISPATPLSALRFVAALDMSEGMQKAIVKSLGDEPNLTITLQLGGKLRNLDRPKNEPLEKPLMRIQKSAAPQPDKRQRRQQQKAAPAAAAGNGAQQHALSTAAAAVQPGQVASAFEVALYAGPTLDSPMLDAAAVSNADAWQHGRVLRVGTECYQVEFNPPMIDRLEVPPGAFVGVPLFPLLAAHFAEEEACSWRWFRRPAGAKGSAWEEIEGATQRRYVPGAEDEGCLLCVECTPGRRRGGPFSPPSSPTAAAAAALGELSLGEPCYAECGPVVVPPEPLGAQPRLELTRERAAAPEFRVVSYNILADQYASTDTAKRVLFSHCPAECLAPEYRRPLVLAELLGFQADIVCLQEVDDKMFTQLLQPQLGAEGYEGVYTNKAGKVREGSALFFRSDRFRLVAQRDLTLRDFFPPSPAAPAEYAAVFEPMLRSSPQLAHALQKIATVAQLALLAPAGPGAGAGAPLLVVNTHLFFHYMAPHIRTMHTWVIMQEAQRFIESLLADPAASAALGGRRPSLLFCGDFNSDLNDGIPGAIELLSKGRLGAGFWDWEFGVGFRWGMGGRGAEGEGEEADPEASGSEFGEVQKMVHGSVEHAHPLLAEEEAELVPGVELSLPFRLAAADAMRSPFTNYVRGYQGLLDYVWYNPEDVEVAREVPLPTSATELGGYLPNARFPSDHLPVVFDLRFKAAGAATAAAARGGSSSGAAGSGSGSGSDAAGGSGSDQGASGSDENGSGNGRGGTVRPAALYNVGLAVDALQAGEVIAVPTDTLYGLAACASTHEGMQAIYHIKRRPILKPLAICVADVANVPKYGHTEHLPKGLLEELLPGAVTLLLRRRADAPLAPELNPGVDVVGIRVPDSLFIRAICRQHGGALALTSANVSQGLSSVCIEEFQELWPSVSLVFDGGSLTLGRAGSTVIDLSEPGRFRIQRRGAGFSEAVRMLTEKYGLEHAILTEFGSPT